MNERAILTRTHRLAKSRSEHVETLAQTYPVTKTQVTNLFTEAKSEVSVSVEGDPAHVVVRHEPWDYEVTGWNRTAALAFLVEAYLNEHHPAPETSMPDDIHEAVNRAFGSYHPPKWEQQLLGLNDGGYNRAFILTNLTQTNEILPVEWCGLTEREEFVYIRYRGGALRIYVTDGIGHTSDDVAYKKQIAPFPASRLATEELLTEQWPDWASYTDPLKPLPDEWHEKLSQSYIDVDEALNRDLNDIPEPKPELDEFDG